MNLFKLNRKCNSVVHLFCSMDIGQLKAPPVPKIKELVVPHPDVLKSCMMALVNAANSR